MLHALPRRQKRLKMASQVMFRARRARTLACQVYTSSAVSSTAKVSALEACQSRTARDLLVGMGKLSSLAPRCSGGRAPLSAALG